MYIHFPPEIDVIVLESTDVTTNMRGVIEWYDLFFDYFSKRRFDLRKSRTSLGQLFRAIQAVLQSRHWFQF